MVMSQPEKPIKVLVTGATGNVGMAVISALLRTNQHLEIHAGVRNPDTDKFLFPDSRVICVPFDFTQPKACEPCLATCDILFLLRPPQLSDIRKYFQPIITGCKSAGIRHIVFLSVQGAEKSKMIPHHKIEELVLHSGIPYTFLRPGYFMQNFTTTLRNNLIQDKKIFLPAGDADFALIDVRDIGEVAAVVLSNTSAHKNKSYELTSQQRLNFQEMAKILSNQLGTTISYESPNLLRFFLSKKREKMPVGFILVMMMLHFLPRFQPPAKLTDWVERITGKKPITFQQFIADHRKELSPE
jgi:uncharacterized protein YbjT (DUF2867 family)